MLRKLLRYSVERILQEDDEDAADGDADVDIDGDDEMAGKDDFLTYAPTSAPGSNTPSSMTSFGIILVAGGAIVGIIALYRYCQYWAVRRERHLLAMESSRADDVLGDMQMVIDDDDDYNEDDPELL